MHPEFAPIAFLSSCLLLLPLPWHWRSRNVATLAMIGWLFAVNIIFAIDALIWGDNVAKVVPIWCDITTKIIIGANFALPAACVCICVHLEKVASGRISHMAYTEKKRRKWFELCMCTALPFLFMILHYIVQGHRFDIIEGYGCRPATYFSIVSIFIVHLPPIILSIISMIFAAIALRHFFFHRLTFAAHLSSSNSALTTSRYLRLITMAALQMVWTITATSYSLWFTFQAVPLRPWTTWDDVHSNWLRIDVFPDFMTPPRIKQSFYFLWWITPISTLLFVIFFSFGKDATDEYVKCFKWVKGKFFHRSTSKFDMKSAKGFSVLTSEATIVRGLPISKPTLSIGPESSPRYQPSLDLAYTFKTTETKTGDIESDGHSQTICYASPLPYRGGPKAIGSYTDLSVQTPSTLIISPTQPVEVAKPLPELPPETPENPLTPPHSLQRGLRPRIFEISYQKPNSRRLTYPSYDTAHRNLNVLKPSFK